MIPNVLYFTCLNKIGLCVKRSQRKNVEIDERIGQRDLTSCVYGSLRHIQKDSDTGRDLSFVDLG